MSKWWGAIALCGLWPLSVVANWYGANFSAEIVQQAPQQAPLYGRMYVDGSKVRTEMSVGGRSQVEIFNPELHSDWLLDPANKVYMYRALPALPGDRQSGTRSSNPCAGIPGAACADLGEQELNGRKAHKWSVKRSVGGHALVGSVWVDSAHDFPVRQEFAGRVISQMRFLGEENIGGRRAEKWQAVTVDGNGRTTTSLQWYDVQLNLAIRQDLGGGFTRELRNIRIGNQPAELFNVPADYRQVEASPSGTGGYPPR